MEFSSRPSQRSGVRYMLYQLLVSVVDVREHELRTDTSDDIHETFTVGVVVPARYELFPCLQKFAVKYHG